MIPPIRWLSKDKDGKIWLFEHKPSRDKDLDCWFTNRGEEWFDIDRLLIPHKTYKLICNHMRRIKKWEDSITKINPNTWMIE